MSPSAMAIAHAVSAPLTMPLAEVSAAMGLTEESLMRKHRRLTAENGFPRPLPGSARMWSRAAFEAWVRANGVQSMELDADEPQATAGADRVTPLVRAQNEMLRARYGGGR